MKDKDIESILRDSRPQVKDNPAFLLEVQQKMHAVEGIKSEVDRQRRYGRTALILTLVAGLILGASAMLLAYLYPIDTSAISDCILSLSRFIQTVLYAANCRMRHFLRSDIRTSEWFKVTMFVIY